MKQSEHLKDLPRPFATAQRSHMCDSPASSFRSIKDKDHPYNRVDRRFTRDPGIPASLKGLVLVLLDYPSNYEFRHMVKIIETEERCCKKTAYKYLNQLIDAGYIHPVEYQDVNQQWVRRYKVSELPVRPGPGEDPNPRTPLRAHGLQTSKCQSVGFPLGVKPGTRGKLDSKLTVTEMITGINGAIRERTEARRVVGFEEWKTLQAVAHNSISVAQKPGGKIYSTNKGSNGCKINLTQKTIPTLPGEGFFSFFDEAPPSTAVLPVAAVSTEPAVAPVTCGPAAPAKRKTAPPKTPAASRVMSKAKIERIDYRGFSQWSEDRRVAPTGADLDTFLANYAATYPAAVAAIEEAGNTGTVKWAEAMLANPLIGMVQELLGLESWTYELLRKWSRRLRKGTVSTDDVVLLWTSKQAGSPYVDKALDLWDKRGYRTLVPATHYATGVAIWPPDLSWVQIMQRLRRDATTRLVKSLPAPYVPRRINPNDGTCTTSDSTIHPVEERFAAWVSCDNHVNFFSAPDAAPYFLGLVQQESLLWAMVLPRLQDGMPQAMQQRVALLTANVSVAEMQATADEAMAMHAVIPGGLTRTLLSTLYTESDDTQVKLSLAYCVLADYIPVGPEEVVADAFFDTDRQRELASYIV